MKFANTPHEEAIRLAKSPKVAAALGRSREHPLRADWEVVKEQVMYDAVRAKFTQYADLRRILLETGDERLVERRRKDAYWGDGGDGSGLNRLGEILMRLRAKLRAREASGSHALQR